MPKHHTASLPIAIETERPIGRPTLYRPELCDQIIEAMGEGLSLEAAGAACGVGTRTVFIWQNQHEEFRQAVEEGRTKALLFWERRAIALSKGESGNAAVITLGLKNRSRAAAGWHDAQRLEHSGPDGGAIQQQVTRTLDISTLNDEQLEALEMALLATMGAGNNRKLTLSP